MGNLHQGHLDLVEKALSLGPDIVVIVTIFVNPLQFTGTGGSDFNSYPRTLEHDIQNLVEARCHLLFTPKSEEIYAKTPIDTKVNVGSIGRILEGEFRPGTFEGVATVVLILINLCKPSVIILGEKDWQQLQVVKQFIRDLHVDVEVISVATRREENGLAMSSRNNYLSSAEKLLAIWIYETLKWIESELRRSSRTFEALEEQGKKMLTSRGFEVQYLTIRQKDLSEPNQISTIVQGELVILVACTLNKTRLIDNIVVKL